MARSRSTPPAPSAAIAILLVTVSVLFTATPHLSDGTLISLDRRQPAEVPTAELSQMTVIQELANSWLVEVPSTLMPTLQARGVSFTVLEEEAGNPVRYLIFGQTAEQIEQAAPLGRVHLLEAGVGLLSCDHEFSRDLLPADVSIKLLSGPIATPLSFQIAGERRAVVRQGLAEREAPYNPRIAEMAGNVSQQALTDEILDLQNFQTRYASTSNLEAAGSSILGRFTQAGLAAESDYFTFSGTTYTTSNVIATLPGRVAPDRVVIVCAHYDSTSALAKTNAPGADDNASGTAAVIEMARALAGFQFDYTIKFIAFSAEEWGLYGSKHYAQAARQRGEDIVGVVNLDMIGYVDFSPEDLDIVVDAKSAWLGNSFAASAALYAPLAILQSTMPNFRGSDHSPFWDQGYSALCGIEDTTIRNPYYHTIADTIGTLNLPFATAVTRAATAAVAELAQPVSIPPAPTGVRVQVHTIASLFTTRKTSVVTWNASTGEIAGYNVYRSLTPRVGYERANASPVKQLYFVDRLLRADMSYYYAVTAVDTAGRESNFSVEVQ